MYCINPFKYICTYLIYFIIFISIILCVSIVTEMLVNVLNIHSDEDEEEGGEVVTMEITQCCCLSVLLFIFGRRK